jgi:hypothetical protein
MQGVTQRRRKRREVNLTDLLLYESHKTHGQHTSILQTICSKPVIHLALKLWHTHHVLIGRSQDAQIRP